MDFIDLFISGHLGCFHFGALLKNAAINFVLSVFYVDVCFHFPWVYGQEWNCWVS